MDKFFGNLHAVLGTGLVLAIILMLCLNGQNFEDGVAAGNAIMRWIHTFFGVLWIGLLYYFNFVQMATMRSEARRVGKEGGSTCRSRWWRIITKKNKEKQQNKLNVIMS